MDSKKLFDKYYSRLAREGMLKALLCGIVIGFAVDFVIALVTWFIPGLDIGYAIALVAGLVVGVIAAIIFYHKAFKPTTKKIARRIDSLGLEERLITMTELENDESYIAMRQREDAQAKLNEVNSKSIRFVIAKSLIIAAVVVGVVGLSMTTVNALAGAGLMPNPNQIGNPDWDEPPTAMVSYIVDNDDAGWIDGEADQVVYIGDNAASVLAVANEGYVFVEWKEDKYTSPERNDYNITGDVTYTAVFEELEYGGSSDSTPDNPEDLEPSDQPPEQKEGDAPQTNMGSDNVPDDGNRQEQRDPKFSSSNQIKTGEIPYQDDFDIDYQAAMDRLLNDSNLTDKERAMLELYFEQLRAGAGTFESDGDLDF
ncbi:MAG: hypothetical protein J1F36_04080 [Clostridiales bacterium]|nr:hypothetical protein [Clostridiales bacterium]